MVERVLLSLLVSLSLVLFLGCPSDSDDDAADDDAGDDDGGDDDGGDDDGGDDDTLPPEEPYFTGVVYDESCTNPIDDIRITFCREVCLFQNTDADGRFLVQGLSGGVWTYDVIGHVNPTGATYTGIYAMYELQSDGFVEALDSCMPLVPTENIVSLSSGMQDVDVGAGLVVTLDPDEVEFLLQVPELGAVEVAQTAWEYVQIPDHEVLGVWAFYVWGNTPSQPVAISFPGPGNLECDQAVDVLSMLETDLEEYPDVVGDNFEIEATATYDCILDRVVMDPGQGVTRLTWVAMGVPN